MSTTTSRLPAWAKKLILVVLATLFALLLAEGLLRAYFWSRGVGRGDVQELLRLSQRQPATQVDVGSVFGIVQPSPFPDVVYELRPNLRGKFRGQPFRTNAFGLRGPDVERSKGDGVLRIAALGDSHMFGWGVGQDEMYLSLLQQKLRAAGYAVEILCFAAPGYNTAIEVATYERKARHFAPDLVLMHFIGNDLGLPHHLQPPRTLEPSDWFVVELLGGLFAPKALDGEMELLPHNLRKVDPELRQEAKGQYAYMLGEAGYRRAMARLAELTRGSAKEAPVPVFLVSLGERELVEAVAAEHGFQVYNPAPVFLEILEQEGLATDRQTWKRVFRIPDDGHPSVLAHRAYAEALARELVARKLVSR